MPDQSTQWAAQPAEPAPPVSAGPDVRPIMPPDLRPDFQHVRNWVFDLDNTLYRADCGVFAQIERRMTEFVSRLTGQDMIEARRLQKDLYRKHGTTLNGLMLVHGIDPEPYLDYVHDVDLDILIPDADLCVALTRLPGRRFIFTNGCRNHAARILARLEIAHLFEDIWDIRTIGFVPKPDPAGYEKIVAHAGFAPAQAAMFDDIAHNLAAARALGMTTVWLKSEIDWSPLAADIGAAGVQGIEFPVAPAGHIDHETADLTLFLNTIRI